MGTDFNLEEELELVRQTEHAFRMQAPAKRYAVADADKRETIRFGRFFRRVFVPLVLVGAALVGGFCAGQAAVQTEIVPSCSVYKYTRTPALPEGTSTTQCVVAEPNGDTSIYTGDGMWKAGF